MYCCQWLCSGGHIISNAGTLNSKLMGQIKAIVLVKFARRGQKTKNSGADAKQQLDKSTSPYELPVEVTKSSSIVAVLLQVYGKRTRQEEEEEDEE